LHGRVPAMPKLGTFDLKATISADYFVT